MESGHCLARSIRYLPERNKEPGVPPGNPLSTSPWLRHALRWGGRLSQPSCRCAMKNSAVFRCCRRHCRQAGDCLDGKLIRGQGCRRACKTFDYRGIRYSGPPRTGFPASGSPDDWGERDQ
ncbi:hypothetical protein GWL_35160 [Herbaspirillum sp. GW103]|nr:hypothetical protein GWL_35160 [Herbaspirillum sp. GW103]